MKDNAKQGTENHFEFSIDQIPYEVRVTTEIFNDEKRFRIKINGDEGHLYVWDPEAVALRALDDQSSTLPDDLEREISNRLVKTIVMD